MTWRWRTLARHVHLWLGLSVGLFFVLLGLTGSALVFYQEIDALLHPAIRIETKAPAPGWTSSIWDRALETVRRQWPGAGGQWRFEATGEPGPIAARYYPSGAPTSHMTKRMMVWLSPDGARVLRHDGWGDYAMSWIHELHMDLLSGEAGHKVVGWSGAVILVLLSAGVIAWWPRGSWRKGLAFKPAAAPIRRLHDIHKLAGLWSFILLILFAITGFMLALPTASNWLLERTVARIDAAPSPQAVPSAGRPITISAALSAGHRALPEARLAWIEMPSSKTGMLKLRVQVPGDPSRRFPHSYIYVDPYSGAVRAIVDARKSHASTAITNWLHPLHDASVGGLPTRILAFVVGLVPAVLFFTGLLRWYTRRVHRQRSAQKSRVSGS
ncbi:MAG: PepSY domain-containing protein [Sphingobium sp.]|uniref:PepSY-associated TM helix domain-containing protein n=1 Tax=Sphingobium sp. TaxID=1912891 RepID=UPI000DB5C4F4|nr:PepSY-associated TM helix domain-containing protein [Sphingobium sp.]PZU08434.1 MAG: PepSY domain-containing protein [Sphingobium sp.]